MEKRIIYRTEVSVSNMMLEAEKGMEICSEEVEEVFLAGYISYYSRRKLFGLIQLPDKYVYKVYPHLIVRNKYTNNVYVKSPSFLSFESKNASWRRHRTWSHGCATSASSTSKASRMNNKKRMEREAKPLLHPLFCLSSRVHIPPNLVCWMVGILVKEKAACQLARLL